MRKLASPPATSSPLTVAIASRSPMGRKSKAPPPAYKTKMLICPTTKVHPSSDGDSDSDGPTMMRTRKSNLTVQYGTVSVFGPSQQGGGLTFEP